MKLTFIIADTWGPILHAQYTGQTIPIRKRTVTIDLTSEQVNKLNLQKTGTNKGKDVFEEVEDVIVEKGTTNNSVGE